MIFIGNTTAYALQLKTPSNTAVENEMINRMANYQTTYSFYNLEHFHFTLKLRSAIIQAAKELLASKAEFTVFEDSKCNARYWILTRTGGFQLRNGVQPSNAIHDIFVNGKQYGFECATAIVIIFYKAVLQVFGNSLFDRLYQGIYLRDWRSDEDLPIVTTRGNDYLPGDCVYFNNPEFDPNKSYWRGENAIDLGNGTFYGHGVGIKTSEEMIEALNKRRKPYATQSAYLLSQVTRLDDRYLFQFSPRSTEEPLPRFLAANEIVGKIGQVTFYL